MAVLAAALAAAAAATVSGGIVPGVSWALAAEAGGGPLRARADVTAFTLGGVRPLMSFWSASLEAPVLRWGAFSAGPLAGVGQLAGPGGCMGFACDPGVPAWPTGDAAAFVLGGMARWEAGPWRVTVAPWALVRPRPALPAIPGSGGAPIPQAPDVLLGYGLAMGPPLLAVDYRVAGGLALTFRTNLVPVALAWRF